MSNEKCVLCFQKILLPYPQTCLSCDKSICGPCNMTTELLLCIKCMDQQAQIHNPCYECQCNDCSSTSECPTCNKFYCNVCISVHKKCHSCEYGGYRDTFLCTDMGVTKCLYCSISLCTDHVSAHQLRCQDGFICCSCDEFKAKIGNINKCPQCHEEHCRECFKPRQCIAYYYCGTTLCSRDHCRIRHEKECCYVFQCVGFCTYFDVITPETKTCIAPGCEHLQCPFCVKDYNWEKYDTPICSEHSYRYLSLKSCGCCNERFPLSRTRKVWNRKQQYLKVCDICYTNIKEFTDILLYKKISKDLIQKLVNAFIFC